MISACDCVATLNTVLINGKINVAFYEPFSGCLGSLLNSDTLYTEMSVSAWGVIDIDP